MSMTTLSLLLAFAQEPPTPPVVPATPPVAVTLRFRPPYGKVYRFRMTSETPEPDAKSLLDMTMRMVNKGEKNDRVNFVTSMESFTMQGKPLPPEATEMLKKMRIVEIFDRTAKRVSSEIVDGPEGFDMEMPTSAAFPAEPVSVGSSWTAKVNALGQEANATYTVDEIGVHMGERALRVKTDSKGAMGLQDPSYSWYALADGLPLSAEWTVRSGGMTIVSKMVRL